MWVHRDASNACHDRLERRTSHRRCRRRWRISIGEGVVEPVACLECDGLVPFFRAIKVDLKLVLHTKHVIGGICFFTIQCTQTGWGWEGGVVGGGGGWKG